MRGITRRVLKTSTYIIFPIMMGLIAVAKPLVDVILTPKWEPCVIYLQICCFALMFRPLQFINTSVIQASGHSGLLLKLDLIKKGFGIFVLLISIPFGVKGIAISLVISNLFSTFINIMPNRQILQYGYALQIKDIQVNFILAFIMGVVTYSITFIPLNVFVVFFLQIIIGIVVYVSLSYIFSVDSFVYLLGFIKKIKSRKARGI